MAAPGPSLTDSVVREVRESRLRTIAVQDAYRVMPWADALYACNPSWWRVHRDCNGFAGEKWSTHEDGAIHLNDKTDAARAWGVKLVGGRDGQGFSLDPGVIHYGSNSGFQAINLAILKGCTRIVLIGFDMRRVDGRSHFFGEHPDDLRRDTDYSAFIRPFELAAKALPPHIEILNATPGSALKCFPSSRILPEPHGSRKRDCGQVSVGESPVFQKQPRQPARDQSAAFPKWGRTSAAGISSTHTHMRDKMARCTLDDILRAWPTLQNAVQPPQLPRVNGTFHLSPEKDWNEFVAGMEDFRFRESDPCNHVGPFRSTGDCLQPFSQPGDLVWIDPTLEPTDGDFVIVAWGPRSLASTTFQGAAQRWRDMYGVEPGPIATKRLRRLGHSWVLCVRRSHYWLEPDDRILGVLVRRERSGEALHSPSAHCITPNAATEVYSSSVAGPTTITPLAADVTRVTVPAQSNTYVAVVTATGDFWRNNSSPRNLFVLLTTVGGVSGVTGNLTPFRSTASPGERFSLRDEFTVSDGLAHDFALRSESGVIGSQSSHENVRLQVEIIKR